MIDLERLKQQVVWIDDLEANDDFEGTTREERHWMTEFRVLAQSVLAGEGA
jgi:hypothetical protein